MAQTLLKPQGMDTTTRLVSKVIAATRDMSAASGDVSYTGVGFVPTAIIAFGSSGGDAMTIGGSDSSKSGAGVVHKTSVGYYTLPTDYFTNNLIAMDLGGGNICTAIVKSYESDGFILTWTKTGSPTGTLKLTFLCFR